MTPSLFCWSCIRSAGLREEKATFSSGLFLGLTVTFPVSPRQSFPEHKDCPTAGSIELPCHLATFSLPGTSVPILNETELNLEIQRKLIQTKFQLYQGGGGHTTKQAKQLPSSYHSDSY